MIKYQYDNMSIHRFAHQAMATIYEIMINLKDKSYAEQAAQAAFEEIDRLEDVLSRFRPNSDIARINSLKPGKRLPLGEDTWECIRQSKKICKLTKGFFDITVGSIMPRDSMNLAEIKRNIINSSSKTIGMNSIELHEYTHSLSLLKEGISIDLGGFGKGYAIDKVYEILQEWDITDFLIHGGGSSVKACGCLAPFSGWPLTLSNPSNPEQTLFNVMLQNNSIGASGLKKGYHIINPQTREPVNTRNASWALAKSAALSDALSTAFMIMPKDEIKELCNANSEISGLVIEHAMPYLKKTDLFICGDLLNSLDESLI